MCFWKIIISICIPHIPIISAWITFSMHYSLSGFIIISKLCRLYIFSLGQIVSKWGLRGNLTRALHYKYPLGCGVRHCVSPHISHTFTPITHQPFFLFTEHTPCRNIADLNLFSYTSPLWSNHACVHIAASCDVIMSLSNPPHVTSKGFVILLDEIKRLIQELLFSHAFFWLPF